MINLSDLQATDICVDAENRVVTTPAYMRNSPIHVVRDGINKMVEEVLKMALCVWEHTRFVIVREFLWSV